MATSDFSEKEEPTKWERLKRAGTEEEYSASNPPPYETNDPTMPNPLYGEPNPTMQGQNFQGYMSSYPAQPQGGRYGDATVHGEPNPKPQGQGFQGYMSSYPPQPQGGGYGDTPVHTSGYNPYMQPQYGNNAMQSSHATQVVVTQPAHNTMFVTTHVPDYTALAWIACLCFCWPVGLCAVTSACQSRDALAAGNIEEARQAATAARTYSIIAIVLGIVLAIASGVAFAVAN